MRHAAAKATLNTWPGVNDPGVPHYTLHITRSHPRTGPGKQLCQLCTLTAREANDPIQRGAPLSGQ